MEFRCARVLPKYFNCSTLSKGIIYLYVLILYCILISNQVHRCAGICCILSHPLPFKKYVRLAHGRYSHVTVSSSYSTNMTASTTTWPLGPLSARPTAATATALIYRYSTISSYVTRFVLVCCYYYYSVSCVLFYSPLFAHCWLIICLN
jgi:hypothetical protein